MDRNRFYWILSLFYLTGLFWILFFLFQAYSGSASEFSPCIFKWITGLPCPSCGATRSLMALVQGRFEVAFFLNPLGYFYLILALVFPVWLAIDLAFRKESLFSNYLKFNSFFRNKWTAFPALALVLSIWIWNIIKNT